MVQGKDSGNHGKLIVARRSHESCTYEIEVSSTAIAQKISHATNLSAAEASVKGMHSLRTLEFKVKSIQEYHA